MSNGLSTHYLKVEKAIILSGFRAAEISEAIENAKSITEKVENPGTVNIF